MRAIYQIDVSAVTEPQTYSLQLSKDLCDEIATRFHVPAILNVNIEMSLTPKNSIWELTGTIDATVQLMCVKSKQLFVSTFQDSFFVILSYVAIDNLELDVELLEQSTVDIGDIAIQYLAMIIPTSPLHPEFNDASSKIISHPSNTIQAEWKQSLSRLKHPK